MLHTSYLRSTGRGLFRRTVLEAKKLWSPRKRRCPHTTRARRWARAPTCASTTPPARSQRVRHIRRHRPRPRHRSRKAPRRPGAGPAQAPTQARPRLRAPGRRPCGMPPVGESRADYSHKHRRHGVTVQVVTDPEGRLLRIWPARPGRGHDLTTARTHRIIRICGERPDVQAVTDRTRVAQAPGTPPASNGLQRQTVTDRADAEPRERRLPSRAAAATSTVSGRGIQAPPDCRSHTGCAR